MCLILFSFQDHPRYKLVVAANRDEFYKRPTRPADFWDENSEVLAGKDLEGGGTWMGVNKSGKISMLTNYRDPFTIKDSAPSRGHLVSDFLQNQDDAIPYLNRVEANGKNYNGFNLICGSMKGLHYYGNNQKGVQIITAGIHGLSNALLDSHWPKVEKGKAGMKKILDSDFVDPESLFEMLADDRRAKSEHLPDTGVGFETESMLSPLFIKSEVYGSRCSTVILVEEGSLQFFERTYNQSDFSSSTVNFEIPI